MKQNLVVLLADMFNLFEIHPAPCVDYPESENATGEFIYTNYYCKCKNNVNIYYNKDNRFYASLTLIVLFDKNNNNQT